MDVNKVDVTNQEPLEVEGSQLRSFEIMESVTAPIFTQNDLRVEISPDLPSSLENNNTVVEVSSDQIIEGGSGAVSINIHPVGDDALASSVPVNKDTEKSPAINPQVITSHDHRLDLSAFQENVADISSATFSTNSVSAGIKQIVSARESCGETTGMEVNVRDALQYLDKVKYRCITQTRPEVYDTFVDIMRAFKTHNLEFPYVVDRISDLFKGNPDLIEGFNVFLPPIYRLNTAKLNQQPLQMTTPAPALIARRANEKFGYSVVNVNSVESMLRNQAESTVDATASGLRNQCWNDFNCTPGSNEESSMHKMSFAVTENSMSQPTHIPSNIILHVAQVPSCPPVISGEFLGQSKYLNDHGMLFPMTQVDNAYLDSHVQHPDYEHAVDYVNKIKSRLTHEEYLQFLEILHVFRRQQKKSESSSLEHKITEYDICLKASKLFEGHKDLMEEFLQFVPQSSEILAALKQLNDQQNVKAESVKTTVAVRGRRRSRLSSSPSVNLSNNIRKQTQKLICITNTTGAKTTASNNGGQRRKKLKLSHIAEPKPETSVFDELTHFMNTVQRLLQASQYADFLRVLYLYNIDIISHSELVQLVTNLLHEHRELITRFKSYIIRGSKTPSSSEDSESSCISTANYESLDPSTCRRLGKSYIQIPKTMFESIRCSGRTPLCNSVLNDEWLSFPAWTDGVARITRKLPNEEYTNQIDDQRFELDFIIQTNADTINYLEVADSRMKTMSSDRLTTFGFDESFGAQSGIHLNQAVKRLYGNAAVDIIEGLNKRPDVAIPIVLKRLKQKDEEWRMMQRKFNKSWKEDMERFYYKTLDHQGCTFKQCDIKSIRTKALVAEIKTKSVKQRERADLPNGPTAAAPHLCLSYKCPVAMSDACELLLHHVRRHSGLRRECKQKIKEIMKQFIPSLFQLPEMEMSDNEEDPNQDSDEKYSVDYHSGVSSTQGSRAGDELIYSQEETVQSSMQSATLENTQANNSSSSDDDFELKYIDQTPSKDENYRLLFVNQRWYTFLRLHHLLCDRLTEIRQIADNLINASTVKKPTASHADILCLAKQLNVEDLYPTFLTSVKDLLDKKIDSGFYEDQLLQFFGAKAFIAFTLDKVIISAVSQLQYFPTEPSCRKCIQLFHDYSARKDHFNVGSENKPLEESELYASKADAEFGSDFYVKVKFYGVSHLMTMELVSAASDKKKLKK